MTGDPLPHCQFSVERAYEGSGESYDFIRTGASSTAATGGAEGLRAFDLRDVSIEDTFIV